MADMMKVKDAATLWGLTKDVADAFLHQVNEWRIFQLHVCICVMGGRNFLVTFVLSRQRYV